MTDGSDPHSVRPRPVQNVYVARQPIFDRHQNIYAYELLFRSGFHNFYDSLDADLATSKTILNSFSVLGMDMLTGGKMVFVNFTRNLIIKEVATIFPKELLAIEILESVTPDEEVIRSCRRLKKAGYLIALDDFVLTPQYYPMVDIADIIKIDFRIAEFSDRHTIMKQLGNKKIKFLAEKVETQDEFRQAHDMGFNYFQGYFFSRPIIVHGKDVPGYKLAYLQILREVNNPDADFEDIEHIVKRDVSLAYKLLRFINSATFSFPAKIKSIRQALALLGMKEIKKWASLIALSSMGNDKPEELVNASMYRAKFSELIAWKIGMSKDCDNLFLTGMFSMIDAFMDQPMDEILLDLPLADPIKKALMGENNVYREIVDLAIAYERADWEKCFYYLKRLNLKEEEMPDIFATSIQWVHRIFKY